jgi:hypothetical protein
MKSLHFTYRDLLRAPRLAFGIQRIWINGLGFFIGYVVYLILTYFSGIIGGYHCSYIWSEFGLLPCTMALSVPWYSTLVYIIGLFLFIAIMLMTNTAVSRAVYMSLRDELFYTWTQAYKFALKKWVSVLGSLITFIFIILFFVIAALVMGFIGKIPFIGELGTVLLTVPYIFASLLLFFIIITFIVALFFVPAIIATSDEDALGGVFQSFSITFNQPWRIILYSALLGFVHLFGVFLFAAILKIAYHLYIFLFSLSMGDKIVALQKQALYIIDQSLPTVLGWVQALPFGLHKLIYLGSQHPIGADLGGAMAVSGTIFGMFLLFFGGLVISYGEAIWNAGLTLIYIILYKNQEKENLLEREDEELQEEEEEEEEEGEAGDPGAETETPSDEKPEDTNDESDVPENPDEK